MRISQSIVVLIALLALCLPGWALVAMPMPVSVAPSLIIKGAQTDEALLKSAPQFVADPVALNELWAKWKIAEPMPTIDFTRNILAVDTTVGSILNPSFILAANGNMTSVGMATMDFMPGFRYVLSVVSRAGVKAYNDKMLLNRWMLAPSAEFKGTVADDALLKNVPEMIVEGQGLKEMWASLKIADNMPTVDFTRQFVITDTTVGSMMSVTYFIDITGNITSVSTVSTVTKDIAPGFRYAFAVFSREGCRTVRGQALPGKIIPSATFTASVKDETLAKGTPTFINATMPLQELWAKWAIAGKMPEVDFTRDIVLINTTDSTGITAEYSIDAAGNVKVQPTINKDFRAEPGFRYVISVISNAGVLSVDGVAVTVTK